MDKSFTQDKIGTKIHFLEDSTCGEELKALVD